MFFTRKRSAIPEDKDITKKLTKSAFNNPVAIELQKPDINTVVVSPLVQTDQSATQVTSAKTGFNSPQPPQVTSAKYAPDSLDTSKDQYDEKRRKSLSSGVIHYYDSPTSTISSSQESYRFPEYNDANAANAAAAEFLPKTDEMIVAEEKGEFGEFNKLSAFDPVVLYYPTKIADSLKIDKQLLNIDNLFNDVLRSSSNSIMVKYYYKTLTKYQNCQNDQVQTVVDKLDQLTDKYDINYDNYFWLAINLFKKELSDPEIPYLFLILMYFNLHYRSEDNSGHASSYDHSYEVLDSESDNEINDSESDTKYPPLKIKKTSQPIALEDVNVTISEDADDHVTEQLENFILIIENYRVEENYDEFVKNTNILLKLFEPSEGSADSHNMDEVLTTKGGAGGEGGEEAAAGMAVVPVIDNCAKFNDEVNSPKYAFVSTISEIFHDFIPSRCDIDTRLLKTITDKYNELIDNIGDGTSTTTSKLQAIANAPNIESNYFNALASEQMTACDSSNISYDKFTLLTIKTSTSQTEEEYNSQIAILTNLASNYNGYMILPKTEDIIANSGIRTILDLHLYIYSPNYIPDTLSNAYDNAVSRRMINLTDMSPVHDELAQQYNKKELYEAGPTGGAKNPYTGTNLQELLSYLNDKKNAIIATKVDGAVLPAADYHKKHEINSIAGILDSCGSAQPLTTDSAGNNFLLQPDGVYENLMSDTSAVTSAAATAAKKTAIDGALIEISNKCMSKMLSIWADIEIVRHELVAQGSKAKGATFYAANGQNFELHSRDTTVANVSDCIMHCDNVFKTYGIPIVITTIDAIANEAAATNDIFTRLIKATKFIMSFCTTDNTSFAVHGFQIGFKDLFFMVLAFLKSCGDKYQILTCKGVKESYKDNMCMFYTKDKLCALGALVSNTSFTSSFILGQELTAQIDLIDAGDQASDACPAPTLVKLRSSTDTGYLTNERDLFFSIPDFAKLNENILPIIMFKLTGTDYDPLTSNPESFINYPPGKPQDGSSVNEDQTKTWEKTKFNFHKNLLSALKYYDPHSVPEPMDAADDSSSVSISTKIPKKLKVSELIDAEIKQAVYANLNENNVNFLKAAGKRIASVSSLYNTMFEYINQANLTSGLRMAYINAANIVKDRITALKAVLQTSINVDHLNEIIVYHDELIEDIDKHMKDFNENAILELNENINKINKYGTRDRPSRSTDAKSAKNQEADIVAKISEQRTTNKVQAALKTTASIASGIAAGLANIGKRAAKAIKKAQDTVEKAALETRAKISAELEVKTIIKMKTTVETFQNIKNLFVPSSGGYPRKNLIKNKKRTMKKYKKRVKKYTIKNFKKNATNNLKRTIKRNKKYKKRTTIRS
jgi:hypothetical protein